MTLSQNQPKVGTQRSKSPADEVARTGRNSGAVSPAKGFTEHGKSPAEGVSRSGRDSGVRQSGSKGIGKGNADSGSGSGPAGIPDGVGGPLPSA